MSVVEEQRSLNTNSEGTRSSLASSSSGTQSQSAKDYQLDQFGKHIPCVLASQLVGKLFDQFISQDGEDELDQVGAFSCTPSITRFDAALLFVDISGFTVLSQRLPVDELRQCINNYFTIILDTILSFDGDVVKFAGDALFVIWRVDLEDQSAEAQLEGLREATTKAIKCGMEINRLCTDYRVDFKQKHTTDNENIISSLVLRDNNSTLVDDAPPVVSSAPTATAPEADHTFLNVHSGCAAGRFAGIDVGAVDRWEYLIVGQPLQDVAEAEVAAGKGELVVSPYVHSIMCTPIRDTPSAETTPTLNVGEIQLPCGCIQTTNGSFRINHARTVEILEKPQVSDSDDELSKDDFEYAFYRRVVSHAYKAFNIGRERIMDRFYSFVHPRSDSSPRGSQRDSNSKKSLAVSSSAPVIPVSGNSRPELQNGEAEKFVFNFFLRWLMSCLTSDFARHVHEADRLDFEMSKLSRINCLELCAKEYLEVVATGTPTPSLPDSEGKDDGEAMDFVAVTAKKRDSATSASFVRRIRGLVNPIQDTRSSTTSTATSSTGTTSTTKTNNYLREKHQKKHEKLLKKDRDLNGELRNVIVMFISIRSEMKSLWQDDPEVEPWGGKCVYSAFHFLKKTPMEYESDHKLVQHYQTCMTLIVTALREKGGQLRQFIVDDKGTVAIGSFGLRGSANYDNAAAAVEAALDIILHLQNVGLDCSIGITSGRVYCGVVGSVRRHEYAVMGPSVNLSARLMGQAKAGEIICDVSTRSVDRIHSYRHVGEVKAKGYTNLVPIFKPVFNRGSVLHFGPAGSSVIPSIERIASLESPRPEESEKDHPHHATRPPSASAHHPSHSTSSRHRLVGRESEEYEVIHMLLQDIADPSAGVDFPQLTKQVQEYQTGPTTDLLIDTACKSRLAVVHGASGIGKSALISSVCDKMFRYVRKSSWTLQIIHGKSSSLTMSDPLKPWHVIIRTIVSQLSRYYNIVEATREPEVDLSDRSIMSKKWRQGLDYLSSYVTEQDKKLFPLLTTARIVPGIEENEVTSKLSGSEKLEQTVRLLQLIVQQYPVLTNKVLLVVLDDAHFMDAHSWRLVQKLLESSKGVIFLAGYYNAAEDPSNASLRSESQDELKVTIPASPVATGTSKSRQAIHEEVILSHCVSRRIVLGALSTQAIRDMACHVFGGLDLKRLPSTFFDMFEEMSGGNPLYIYEIGLATLERMKSFAAEHQRSLQELLDDPKLIGSFERLLKEFRANRIDEVIYYRFDRLDALSQLVLKLGAVATISNSQRGFTLEMLMHLLLQTEEGEGEEGLLGSFDEANSGREHSETGPSGSLGPLQSLFSCLEVRGQMGNYRAAAEKLATTLRDMVDHHQFIRIIRTRRRSSFQDHLNTAMEAASKDHLVSRDGAEEGEGLVIANASQRSNQQQEAAEHRFRQEMVDVCYDFTISLERKTIYELMLEDQKESLHDRIATYLERENQEAVTPGHYLTFADMAEEGYHWEKATVWGNAMTCFYRAAMLLESQGALPEAYQYLGTSYRMLSLLRKDAKVQESSYQSLSFEALMAELQASTLSSSPDQKKLVESLPEETSDETQQGKQNEFALSRIDVFNTFGGDPHLLDVAIQLLVKLGQTSFTLNEKVAVTARIYEDALRLILLTWPREIASNATLTGFSASSSSRDLNEPLLPSQMKRPFGAQKKRRHRLAEVQSTMQHFQLKDPSSCFPIVAGMAALYRTRRLPDDSEHSKEKCLYQILLNFALTAPEVYRIHYLQANCLMHSLYTELGDYDSAINLLAEIHRWYSPETHSADLVKVYGNDRVPFTIALISQYLVLLGYLPQAEQTICFLTDSILPSMTHLHSLGTLALPLTAVHLLLQNQAQANHCFFRYREMELSRVGSFSFFQEINNIFQDYLQVRDLYLQKDHQTLYLLLTTCVRPNAKQSSSKQRVASSQLSCVHLLDIIEHILHRKYLLRTDRPLVFDAIMSFGVCMEYLCADLLLMIVESLLVLKSFDIYVPMELLSLAVEYCDVALEVTKINHRFMMVYVLLMLTKARIFLLMLCCPNCTDEEKQTAVERLQEALRSFVEVVDREGLDLVRVLLIQLLQGLGAERHVTGSFLCQLFANFFSNLCEENSLTLKRLEEAAIDRLKQKNRVFYVSEHFVNFHEIFVAEIPSEERLEALLARNFQDLLPMPAAAICSLNVEQVISQ